MFGRNSPMNLFRFSQISSPFYRISPFTSPANVHLSGSMIFVYRPSGSVCPWFGSILALPATHHLLLISFSALRILSYFTALSQSPSFAFGPSTDITDYTIINYTPSAAELQPDIAHLPTHVRLQFAEATVLALELAGELAEHPLAFS